MGEEKSAAERAEWGLSHQLFFDVQLEIEGFLGLLRDQIEVHGSICLLPRRLSQDSLESFFGCVRYACGGGNHPELMKVVNSVEPVEKRILAKRRVQASRKRKTNTGVHNQLHLHCIPAPPNSQHHPTVPHHTVLESTGACDETRTKMASWEAKRATPKRVAAASALEDTYGPRKILRRWHLSEPAGFDESWQQHLQPGAAPAVPHPVSWEPMLRIQEWDQKHHFGTKLFHKLTPAHFERTSHSRMNMGIVLAIFNRETARGLRVLRAMYS